MMVVEFLSENIEVILLVLAIVFDAVFSGFILVKFMILDRKTFFAFDVSSAIIIAIFSGVSISLLLHVGDFVQLIVS